MLNHRVDNMAAHRHPGRLVSQGFADARQEIIKWPTNGKWPNEEKGKAMGQMIESMCSVHAKTAFPKIFKTAMGMGEGEAEDSLRDVLDEAGNDIEKRLYFPM